MTSSGDTRHIADIGAASWLRCAETQSVLRAFGAAGFAARIVGGAVRNELLGLAVADVDIATPAVPDDVMRIATAAGFGVVPTGLEHGTVMVIVNHQSYEVTTLRRDVETDGRHATVAFTEDWAADAGRRDFTINALYADADGRVFDPVGGWPDILARRVRFIGDARQRLREDYLRILRFFRFTATYAEAPEPDATGLAACIAEQAGLDRISAERMRVELLKTLVGANALPAIKAMAATGILTRVTGLAPRPAVFWRMAAVEGHMGRKPDPVLRLAALLVAVDEDATHLARRLRLSTAERRTLRDVARGVALDLGPLADLRTNSAAARRLLYASGPERFETLVLGAWANGGSATDDARMHQLLTLPQRWQPPKLPVDGVMLLARGVRTGPRMGEVLRAVEAWWIASDFPSDEIAISTAIGDAIARVEAPG